VVIRSGIFSQIKFAAKTLEKIAKPGRIIKYPLQHVDITKMFAILMRSKGCHFPAKSVETCFLYSIQLIGTYATISNHDFVGQNLNLNFSYDQLVGVYATISNHDFFGLNLKLNFNYDEIREFHFKKKKKISITFIRAAVLNK
jgi:hypothetical protein